MAANGLGMPSKRSFAIMFNGGCLAMHHAVIDHDVAAEDVADALMAEAHPERRDVCAETADDLVGQTRFTRRTRAGRNQDPLRA